MNPHQAAGEPFLSNPQTSLFSPLAWPSMALGEEGFSLAVLARFLLAGFSMLALARELGATELASAVSAFVYLSCGFSVVWAEYPLMFAETDVRRIDLDPTNPKRIWYSGVLSSRIGYVELLQ